MPTQTLNVGVASQQFFYRRPDVVVDFIIQNLSANNIEIGDTATLTYGTGIRIVPNGAFDFFEGWEQDLYLIADGADSDVRILFQERVATRPPVDGILPFPGTLVSGG